MAREGRIVSSASSVARPGKEGEPRVVIDSLGYAWAGPGLDLVDDWDRLSWAGLLTPEQATELRARWSACRSRVGRVCIEAQPDYQRLLWDLVDAYDACFDPDAPAGTADRLGKALDAAREVDGK